MKYNKRANFNALEVGKPYDLGTAAALVGVARATLADYATPAYAKCGGLPANVKVIRDEQTKRTAYIMRTE